MQKVAQCTVEALPNLVVPLITDQTPEGVAVTIFSFLVLFPLALPKQSPTIAESLSYGRPSRQMLQQPAASYEYFNI